MIKNGVPNTRVLNCNIGSLNFENNKATANGIKNHNIAVILSFILLSFETLFVRNGSDAMIKKTNMKSHE